MATAPEPTRARSWQLRTRTLSFGRLPTVMGIVNVTPDSFSDGGLFDDADAAVTHGLQLVAHGAGIVDVGGESTRPHAPGVSEGEELDRSIPVIEALAARTTAVLSVDTSKAAVAHAAVLAGAEIVNDVTGLEGDPDMVDVVRETGAAVCVMHMQGTPRTMQDSPSYDDVVEEVLAYLRDRRAALIGAGIEPARIAVDPGIGFGKTLEHNLTLLRSVQRLHELGAPVVIGHSRKSFLGHVVGDIHLDRDPATIGVSLAMARERVQVVRVHDVAGTQHALEAFDAAGGLA